MPGAAQSACCASCWTRCCWPRRARRRGAAGRRHLRRRRGGPRLQGRGQRHARLVRTPPSDQATRRSRPNTGPGGQGRHQQLRARPSCCSTSKGADAVAAAGGLPAARPSTRWRTPARQARQAQSYLKGVHLAQLPAPGGWPRLRALKPGEATRCRSRPASRLSPARSGGGQSLHTAGLRPGEGRTAPHAHGAAERRPMWPACAKSPACQDLNARPGNLQATTLARGRRGVHGAGGMLPARLRATTPAAGRRPRRQGAVRAAPGGSRSPQRAFRRRRRRGQARNSIKLWPDSSLRRSDHAAPRPPTRGRHRRSNLIAAVQRIIDAIRWVMGASAASRLRSDSLDVIFSGSSARANHEPEPQVWSWCSTTRTAPSPAGTPASARSRSKENAWSSRDGQSQYFLNGGTLSPPRHHRPAIPRRRPRRAQLLDHRGWGA